MGKYINAMVVIVLLILNNVITLHAQEGETIAPSESQSRVVISFGDLSYGEIVLDGRFSQEDVWVPLPHNWQIQNNIGFNINYVASGSLNPDFSTVTILANDLPVASFKPIVDGNSHDVEFTLKPDQIFQQAGVRISFISDLFVTDNPCEIESPAQWVRIEPQSNVKVVEEQPLPPLLSDIRDELIPTNGLIQQRPPLLFIVSSYTNFDELSVAVQLAARIGRGTYETLTDLQIRTPGDLDIGELQNANIVLIGQPTENPFVVEIVRDLALYDQELGSFVTPDNEIVPDNDGFIHIMPSIWNPENTLLIISGNTANAINKIGQIFVKGTSFDALEGPFKFVNAVDDVEASGTISPPWTTETTSFRQLEIAPIRKTGFGASEISIRIPIPRGKILTPGASVTLDVIHSPLIYGSNISVYMNDVFVGVIDTIPATPPLDDRYTFELPVEEINDSIVDNLLNNPSAQPRLNLVIGNNLNMEVCIREDVDMIWTEVRDTSFFTVSFEDLTLPNIALFPYPFVDAGSQNATTLVLPQNATRDDIRLALLLAMRLGDFMMEDTELTLAPMDILSQQPIDSHLILLGEFERQGSNLLDMPIPSQDIYELMGRENRGLILTQPSPFAEGKMIAVISGTDYSLFETAMTSIIYPSTDPRVANIVITDQGPDYITISVPHE